MKFKLSLAVVLCVALTTINIVAFAEENLVSSIADTSTSIESTETTTEVTTPEVTTPEVTTPEVTTPEVTTPEVITPEVITPEVTTPEVTTPEVTTPEVTTPEVTTPEVTTPEVITPEVTTPEVTTPEVITPAPILPEEVVVLPEIEVPLADNLLPQVPIQAEATLTIVHVLHCTVGEAVTEEVVTGLKAGDTINLANYAEEDEEEGIVVTGSPEEVVLVVGENKVEIHYGFVAMDNINTEEAVREVDVQ